MYNVNIAKKTGKTVLRFTMDSTHHDEVTVGHRIPDLRSTRRRKAMVPIVAPRVEEVVTDVTMEAK